MKYHLCCNQLEYCWEIRNKNEEVIFKGDYKEVEEKINLLNNKNNTCNYINVNV